MYECEHECEYITEHKGEYMTVSIGLLWGLDDTPLHARPSVFTGSRVADTWAASALSAVTVFPHMGAESCPREPAVLSGAHPEVELGTSASRHSICYVISHSLECGDIQQ